MQTILGTAAETITCLGCGAGFEHVQNGKGRKPRYCSPECRAKRDAEQRRAYVARRRAGVRINKTPRRSPVMIEIVCEHCERLATVERVHQGNRFCSTKCRDDFHWALRKAKPVGVRQCRACGCDFDAKSTKHHYCSDACKFRVWYPKKRAKRKAQMLGHVDPIRVFDRDGWKCQLCGRIAPKRLRGTNEPMAPELDHIIPLAVGGQHTYENTQCAHRSCNMAKGARPAGQLLLIG